MNKTSKIVLIVIGFVILMGMIGIATNNYQSANYQATQQASENTGRNAFISACAKNSEDRGYCVCVLNNLIELYPDFLYNEARLNRINEVGYYQNETDVMVNCN